MSLKAWYDSMNAIVELTATPLTINKKLYAKWEREKFNISYEKNGGTFSIIEQAKVQTKVKYNLKPILPTPTKSGEYFIGWFKDIAKTMPYNGEKMIGDLTLYAIWITVSDEPELKFSKTDNNFLTQLGCIIF